ncbi:hypothetical protein [Thalassobaculum sp.]|uniref:hypothetical protein n=1 Tax=Thalassobaculum sp. TaxID=2022740 RepID=UPI0032EC83F5
MPSMLVAMPFIWLHRRSFGLGEAQPVSHFHRHIRGRRPAVGCLHCLPPSTSPAANAAPVELPAFLRRQADPAPDPRRQ